MSLRQMAIIILAVIYVLSPVDLIPDIGLVGRIDDLLLVIFLYSRYQKLKTRFGSRTEQGADGDSSSGTSARPRDAERRSPHEILEVSQDASAEEIQAAYRLLAAQYHPDKVQHLGSELRELAHRKMIEIQSAYEQLNGS